MELLNIFANVLLPVFILIGFGVLLDRFFDLDVRTISRITFYVFSPCLIFVSLVDSTVSGADSTLIFGFAVISSLVMAGIGWAAGHLLKLDQAMRSAFLLTVMFMNSGNYGLSVNLFAFGEEGLARAAIFFVASAVLSNSAGIFLAARGKYDWRQAIISVFKAPMLYAAIAGVLVNMVGWRVPTPLNKAFSIAGNAAVPALLLVLGIQLSRTRVRESMGIVGYAAVLRLVVAAGVAFVLAELMGLRGVARQVGIVEASMPSAVTPLLLAVEYDLHPKFVTSVIFVTTLASMITLTFLLGMLM